MEARDPAKLPLIVGNQYQFASYCLCCDQRVQWTNGRAGALELRPNLSIHSCIVRAKFKDAQRAKEILE